MKNLLELKRFQIKGSRVNQIYPLTEHSGAFRVYIGGRSFDVIASVDEGGRRGVGTRQRVPPTQRQATDMGGNVRNQGYVL